MSLCPVNSSLRKVPPTGSIPAIKTSVRTIMGGQFAGADRPPGAGGCTQPGGATNLQGRGGGWSTSGTRTSNGGAITLVGATGLTVANDVLSSGGAINLTGGGATGLVVTAAHNVNAGAGTHKHPTNCLLDLYTMRRELGRLDGLHVSIDGDVQREGHATYSIQ